MLDDRHAWRMRCGSIYMSSPDSDLRDILQSQLKKRYDSLPRTPICISYQTHSERRGALMRMIRGIPLEKERLDCGMTEVEFWPDTLSANIAEIPETFFFHS
jgi:hypothetical protein